MHDFVVSVVAFVVLVGLMVIVHEFGHFAVAKLCRVRVEAFSFGFGPRLFGVKYGETDYKVCLLPLGGYVKMTGETPDQLQTGDPDDQSAVNPTTDPGSFLNHPRWQRVLIGLAGPFANFVLAIVLMVIYFGFINEVPAVQVNNTTLEWVTPDSAAAHAGFQTGDVITHFDSYDNPEWDKVFTSTKLNAGQTVSVTVNRDGQFVSFPFTIPAEAKEDDFDLSDAGLLAQFATGPIEVQDVQPGSPAEKSGLRAKDKIKTVDDHAFHSVASLLAYMQVGKGKPMTLDVDRSGADIKLTATPAKVTATTYKLGFAWAPVPLRNNPLPMRQALKKSTAFCADNSTLIVQVLQRIFTRKIAVSQLSGPVGIARMAGDAAETKGWLPKFGLAAEISLNLGILNLLPFPILDGGLILFLIIESLIRRDISINVKERIYQAAFVVLVAFFVFIIFNDLTKLPIFTHLKP
jgi:regulator of sigma E protease